MTMTTKKKGRRKRGGRQKSKEGIVVVREGTRRKDIADSAVERDERPSGGEKFVDSQKSGKGGGRGAVGRRADPE